MNLMNMGNSNSSTKRSVSDGSRGKSGFSPFAMLSKKKDKPGLIKAISEPAGTPVRQKKSIVGMDKKASRKESMSSGSGASDRKVSSQENFQTGDAPDPPRRLLSLPMRKKETQLSQGQKDLIKECWDTTKHTEFGTRIYTRFLQKRPDIRHVYEDIQNENTEFSWKDESQKFNTFLHMLVERFDDPETIEKMSYEWGARHVPLRDYGFKPSFWVPFSEVMTTECLYLDAGVHPVADMIDAWATLITIMLGQMRDGFYSELRYLRKMSRRKPGVQDSGIPDEPDLNDEAEADLGNGQSPSELEIDQSLIGQMVHIAIAEKSKGLTDTGSKSTGRGPSRSPRRDKH